MSTIAELLERVKDAKGPDRELDAELWKALCWQDHYLEIISGTPFTASIDAALALAERCKPIGYTTRNILSEAIAELYGVADFLTRLPLAILAALLTALSVPGEET